MAFLPDPEGCVVQGQRLKSREKSVNKVQKGGLFRNDPQSPRLGLGGVWLQRPAGASLRKV